jgi:peroxiredoxin
VCDLDGRPLKEYYITITHYVKESTPQGPDDRNSIYKVPVIDQDGRFEINNLPPGEYTVMVRAFDFATHVYDFDMGHFTIPDEADAAAEFNLEVEAKELLHGRAMYEDGQPVHPGWASFGLDEASETHWAVRTKKDGSFRICLSKQERKDRLKVFGGIVKIQTRASWRAEALGQIHIDKLSKDANNPAKIVVPRPKVESSVSDTPGKAEGPNRIGTLAEGAVTLEEILAAQPKQFQRLHSLDMTVTREEFRPVVENKNTLGHLSSASSKRRCRFQLEDEKFRCETGLDMTHVPVGISHDITSFDGKRYYHLSKNPMWLRVLNAPSWHPKYGTIPIVFRPYAFINIIEMTFEAARDNAIWSKLREGVAMGEPSIIAGYRCIPVDIPTGRRGKRVEAMGRVYFATDLGFYPLQKETIDEDGNVIARCTVEQPFTVETRQGPIIIPLTIKDTWYLPDGKIGTIWKYSVDRESLAVNEDVPDGVFKIPLGHASLYGEDWENGQHFYVDNLVSASPELAQARLANSASEESGVFCQPGSIYFGIISHKDLPRSMMIEIMPYKTYLKRQLSIAMAREKEWRKEDVKNAKSLPAGTLEKIEIQSTSPYVIVESESTSESVKIHVQLRKDTPIGLLRENLLVRLPTVPDSAIRVPVAAEIRGVVGAVPPFLFFGNLALDEKVTRSCVVGPLRTNSILKVVEPDPDSCDWLDVGIEQMAGEARINITYTSKVLLQNVKGALSVRLKSDAGNAELLQIPLLTEWSRHRSNIRLGQTAPSIAYKALTGKRTKLLELRGKVVLINFFATWCGHCIPELHALEKKVMKKLPSEKCVVVCVGVGHTIDELKAFMVQQGIQLPMAEDPDKSIFKAFAQSGIPRNYIIDHTGKIVYQSTGYSEDRFNKLIHVLRETIQKIPEQ